MAELYSEPTETDVPWRQAVTRLKVVKEEHGWSVRIGDQAISPFWRRDTAISEANRLANDIRRCGGRAEAVVEDDGSTEPLATH